MNYGLRIFPKDPKKRWWGAFFTITLLILVFFPWRVLGLEPLWFGWLPNWFAVSSLLIIVWVIAWVFYMGVVER